MNAMNTSHIDYTQKTPELFQRLLQLSGELHKSSLGARMIELISLRVSQLNGCVFCLDMHSSALRKAGVDQRKLDTLPAWRESPLFEERERVALDWAELLNGHGTPQAHEEARDALRPHFDDRAISELSFTVAVIRAWNLLNVGMGKALPA